MYNEPMTRRLARLSSEAIELVAARFRILGEPVRIRILQELAAGERSVGDLVEVVGSTQPNVSKHVRILQEAGLLTRRQVGTVVYCSIADPSVFDLCDAVCGSIKSRLEAGARLAAQLRQGRARK